MSEYYHSEAYHEDERRFFMWTTVVIAITILVLGFGMIGCQVNADREKTDQIKSCIDGGGEWDEDGSTIDGDASACS